MILSFQVDHVPQVMHKLSVARTLVLYLPIVISSACNKVHSVSFWKVLIADNMMTNANNNSVVKFGYLTATMQNIKVISR